MIELLRRLDNSLTYTPPNPPVLWREKIRSHAHTTALVKILYGLSLLNPWQDAFVIAPAYHAMAYYFNENVWGAMFFIIGTVQMYTLWKDHIRIRSYVNYLALPLMLFLVGMLLASGVASTGLGTYTALMIGDVVSIIVPRHPRRPYVKDRLKLKDVEIDKSEFTSN